MQKIFCRFLLCFFVFFLLVSASVKAESPSVVINEIAWMGTENSANDEWIELFNNSEKSINLEGWSLVSADGKLKINLSGKIQANSFLLLERTDNTTLPEIKADIIYKGSLSNKGKHLKIISSSGKLIDEVNCSSGWFAGDNKTKQTMERINPLISGNNPSNWQTSKIPGGTPKAKNSNLSKSYSQKITSDENSRTQLKEKENKLLTYPKGIVFSEILPSPKGPDSENEWIEIYNSNNFDVNLSGWKIKDTIGKTTTYTFPPNSKILAKQYLVLKRPETKITLNNSGDKLLLLTPSGEVVDSIAFEKAPCGESFNKITNQWIWSKTPTPGKANKIVSEKKLSVNTSFLKQEKKQNNKTQIKEGSTAKISDKGTFLRNTTQGNKFLGILGIAFGIAIFSGIAILFLKRILSQAQIQK